MEAIVETPKGSAVKYKYDEKTAKFHLLKALPAGMIFPFDFGFIPGTKGEDGDPLDILILSEFATFAGCVVDCRIVGCLMAEQTDGNRMIRNDRFLGIPEQSHLFEAIRTMDDITPRIITEILQFFKDYLKAEGKELRIIGQLDSRQAKRLIQ